jgi:hypothetical protein
MPKTLSLEKCHNRWRKGQWKFDDT